jgi:hypothetical protein
MAFRRSHPDSTEAPAPEPSAPRPAAKWEYKIIAGTGPQAVHENSQRQLEATLNSLACDGWDIVGSSGSVIILRRDFVAESDVPPVADLPA